MDPGKVLVILDIIPPLPFKLGETGKNNIEIIRDYNYRLSRSQHYHSPAASSIQDIPKEDYDFVPYTTDNIADFATAIYLFMWISSDKTLATNLHHFSAYRFENKSGPIPDEDTVKAEYDRLQEAAKKYEKFQQGTDVIYNQVFPKTSTHQETSDPSWYARPIHFQNLWRIDMIKQSPHNILSLYFMTNRLLGSTTKGSKNLPLQSAYKGLLQSYSKIIPMHKSLDSDYPLSQLTDKEYVIASMDLFMLESGGHFLFTAAIAQYLYANSISLNFNKIFHKLEPFYYSAIETELLPRMSLLGTGVQPRHPRIPFLIFPPNFNIIFEDSKNSETYVKCYSYILDFLREVLSILINANPFSKLPPWSDNDFHYARIFLEESFWDPDILKQFKLNFDKHGNIAYVTLGDGTPAGEDKCYNTIRRLYQNINKIDPANTFHDQAPRQIIHDLFKPKK